MHQGNLEVVVSQVTGIWKRVTCSLPLEANRWPKEGIYSFTLILSKSRLFYVSILVNISDKPDTVGHHLNTTVNICLVGSAELTLSYFCQVQPVHPGDFTERAGSVENHHDAHWMTRPKCKKV